MPRYRASPVFIYCTFLISGCITTKSISPAECLKFKEGKYGYSKVIFHHVGQYKEVTERVDSLETIVTLGYPSVRGLRNDTSVFKITWINECVYERTFIKSTDKYLDSLIPLIQKVSKPPRFKIIDYTGKYYIEQSLNDKRQRDTIWIQQ